MPTEPDREELIRQLLKLLDEIDEIEADRKSGAWVRARIFDRAPKAWGSLDDMPGWHRVKFDDGSILCVHESGFRVVDNRAA